MGKVIGIDLGTTNSCVAVFDGTTVQIIPNDIGRRTTPSVVAFSEKAERLVGDVARRQSLLNPAHTIYSVKRLMGRSYNSPEVQSIKPFLPYTLAASENGDVRICSRLAEYSPSEISAMVLQYLKSSAEDFLGEKVTQAIITVPAYFDDSQRQATKDAGRIAGLEVRRIINEPTAAALAYGLGKNKKERVAIFDLGGGTFDITLMEINEGVFEVLSTSGDSFLGGEDFDRQIIEWLVREFQTETGIDLGGDRVAMERLKKAAEKAKCELSLAQESRVSLLYIAKDDGGPRHLNMTLTRAKFEELVRGLIERTTACCEQALSDAKLTAKDIDKVILVGGQTRTPAVQLHVEKVFGKAPAIEVNPDEVVAFGAALQGGVLQGGVKDVVLLDVLPLSLGMETRGGLFTRIIERNSKLPLKKSTVFTTVADNQSTVELHVLQGERELAQHNHSLAKFELVGIPPAPRGAPQIEVAFQIDVNGIVSVSATDKRSGKQQAVKIIPSTGLSMEEINRMVAESERSAEEDRVVREMASLRFRLRELLPLVTKHYYHSRWLLERPEKEKMERILTQAKAIPADTDNLALLRGAVALLQAVSAKLSKARQPGEALTSGDADGSAAKDTLDSDANARKLVKSALENLQPGKD